MSPSILVGMVGFRRLRVPKDACSPDNMAVWVKWERCPKLRLCKVFWYAKPNSEVGFRDAGGTAQLKGKPEAKAQGTDGKQRVRRETQRLAAGRAAQGRQGFV